MNKKTMQLHAGAGKSEIRFSEEMFPTDGFCKVHDAPHVRVLLLESNLRFALVAVELVVVAKPFVLAIKKIVSELTGTPEENIWVHGTHVISTPHAPGPKQKGPPSQRPPMSAEDKRKRDLFTQALETATRAAARDAADTFRPARMGFGAGECSANRSNRDLEVTRGLRAASARPGVSNKTLSILRFDALDGTPIGFLLSYGIMSRAIDNSEMSSCTRQVSSDVPGKACAIVEEALGAPALFCMSAGADQSPPEQACYRTAGENGSVVIADLGVALGLELVERYGTVMGNDAVAIARAIDCTEAAPIIETTSFSFQWESAAPKNEKENIPVLVARIGEIGIVATNPELNCATELELYAASTFPHTLLISMVNGPMKYMPDRKSFEENTYEAQNSFAAPGAAEKFVETAVAVLSTFSHEHSTDGAGQHG